MNVEPPPWTLASPFSHDNAERWLTPFVHYDKSASIFQSVAAKYTHDRSTKFTPADAWRDCFQLDGATWKAARRMRGRSEISPHFPQLLIAPIAKLSDEAASAVMGIELQELGAMR